MKTLHARFGAGWLCVVFFVLPIGGFAARTRAETPGTLRILFLGDNGHHRPADRFKQLQPVLAKRGIELVYTESLDDLNPAKLAGFDCLALFANHTKISPAQEHALLDFVAKGGGFAPLHCASYCFLNSPKYIELVGGQFKSHGTGVFKETMIKTDHPIMKGLSPIESWDETYVHTQHNPDRTVLAERRDDKGAEPCTWIREHGKGRVFYTAWGHDQRTWSNSGFVALVENGLRWASANSPTRLRARLGLKPFEYMEAPAALPNYVAGAKWGTQAEPIRTMQKPLNPVESMKHLVTFPEFAVSLFAAEPDIIKPIWLAWDERGRLWIAETVDYPNNMQPPGEGHDRLKICEDSNGDGRADKFTIFAEQLSVPTSFVFANGGVIVVHSGKTEFLKDTNGDDKADVRKVLFSGWGTGDTHAGPSNLRYGFDNWIWGTVGYSGFRGEVGGKELRFGQGIYRFKPDGSKLEFVRSSNNNTWGLGWSEDGTVFGSTANGNASMYVPIPNRFYEAVNGWSASRLETIADSQQFYPITEKVRQVDWHAKYTAGAGSALYTARSFPKEYWNRVQFVAEPTGHLLGKFHLEARGADFVAHNGRNFLASDDEWTSPIAAEVGRDGALWVIDWYNYIIQHNPTPQGFRNGKGNAYDTPLRDKTHGRIYRVAHVAADVRRRTPQPNPTPTASSSRRLQLDKATPRQLVAALKNDNMLWRLHAQRLLVERGNADVAPALNKLALDKSVDETGLNPAAIHALWTLRGLDALENAPARSSVFGSRSSTVYAAKRAPVEAALAALKHPSASVRRAAVNVLPRTSEGLNDLLSSTLLHDSDSQVRLATLLALSEMPVSDAAGAALYALLKEPHNSEDVWIADAVTSAAARHDVGFLKTVLAGFRPASIGPVEESLPNRVVRLVTAHYAQRGPVDSIVPTLAALKGASALLAVPILDGLVSGWPQGKSPSLGETERQLLTGLMQSLPESARDRLLALAQRWGQTELFGANIAAITESLKQLITDTTAAEDQRIGAAKRLIGLDDKPSVAELVLEQVTVLTPPALATGLVGALTESRAPETGKALTAHWTQFTPAVRRAAIATLMRRADWTMALLDSIQKENINKSDLAAEHWSQLKQNPNRGIAQRAERMSVANATISADREDIVKKLLPLAKEKGDPTRGKEVFTASCAVCHIFNGQGGKVGPDLTGIGSRDRSDILLEILDPNRSVEANYRMWNVTTKDGQTFSGRLDAETQTSVEILDTTGQKHAIQRKDIASLEGSQLSIMPSGLESLPLDDLKGLLEFLAQSHE